MKYYKIVINRCQIDRRVVEFATNDDGRGLFTVGSDGSLHQVSGNADRPAAKTGHAVARLLRSISPSWMSTTYHLATNADGGAQ